MTAPDTNGLISQTAEQLHSYNSFHSTYKVRHQFKKKKKLQNFSLQFLKYKNKHNTYKYISKDDNISAI